MNYHLKMNPEDWTTLDKLVYFDLIVILAFACFAGTSILFGRNLSSNSARAQGRSVLRLKEHSMHLN